MAGLVYDREDYVAGSLGTVLNNVDVWRSADSQKVDGRVWVMYLYPWWRQAIVDPICGHFADIQLAAAWRDPLVDSLSFQPALSVLSPNATKFNIAGFASINYRLSPYPTHPEKPSSAGDLSRNVCHPAHVDDVAQALIYLDAKYNLEKRYLLVGHSAGGTLAFQLRDSPKEHIPVPLAILGVSGIYNFEPFLEAHRAILAYKEFMENAFPDRASWQEACPCTNRVEGATWEKASQIMIAHSDEDELIEKAQAGFIMERLRQHPRFASKVHFFPAKGLHDEIWSSGDNLASLIELSIGILDKEGIHAAGWVR